MGVRGSEREGPSLLLRPRVASSGCGRATIKGTALRAGGRRQAGRASKG